jgi:hypothetical protein
MVVGTTAPTFIANAFVNGQEQRSWCQAIGSTGVRLCPKICEK